MTAEQGPQVDMRAHEQTYQGFIRLLKICAVVSAAITLLVILAISR
ncbi:MAG TPA: aa3-type cytochrome c oxidase subunit IV [Sphingomonadaceae bacterium]|jgi:hypothetical protein|nr:aa3-type cytochrome c oxidase subunit IV [Sphingomonadaceae bacterium]